MKTLKITTRAHQLGSKKWASRAYEIRLVAVPDGAKTPDLRSKGVELIAQSPVLVFWASGNQSSRYPSELAYRENLAERAAQLATANPDLYTLGN